MPTADEFRTVLVDFFSSSTKTGWGKNEIVHKIIQLYVELLEERLRKEAK